MTQSLLLMTSYFGLVAMSDIEIALRHMPIESGSDII
jgi:hypothetical protein